MVRNIGQDFRAGNLWVRTPEENGTLSPPRRSKPPLQTGTLYNSPIKNIDDEVAHRMQEMSRRKKAYRQPPTLQTEELTNRPDVRMFHQRLTQAAHASADGLTTQHLATAPFAGTNGLLQQSQNWRQHLEGVAQCQLPCPVDKKAIRAMAQELLSINAHLNQLRHSEAAHQSSAPLNLVVAQENILRAEGLFEFIISGIADNLAASAHGDEKLNQFIEALAPYQRRDKTEKMAELAMMLTTPATASAELKINENLREHFKLRNPDGIRLNVKQNVLPLLGLYPKNRTTSPDQIAWGISHVPGVSHKKHGMLSLQSKLSNPPLNAADYAHRANALRTLIDNMGSFTDPATQQAAWNQVKTELPNLPPSTQGLLMVDCWRSRHNMHAHTHELTTLIANHLDHVVEAIPHMNKGEQRLALEILNKVKTPSTENQATQMQRMLVLWSMRDAVPIPSLKNQIYVLASAHLPELMKQLIVGARTNEGEQHFILEMAGEMLAHQAEDATQRTEQHRMLLGLLAVRSSFSPVIQQYADDILVRHLQDIVDASPEGLTAQCQENLLALLSPPRKLTDDQAVLLLGATSTFSDENCTQIHNLVRPGVEKLLINNFSTRTETEKTNIVELALNTAQSLQATANIKKLKNLMLALCTNKALVEVFQQQDIDVLLIGNLKRLVNGALTLSEQASLLTALGSLTGRLSNASAAILIAARTKFDSSLYRSIDSIIKPNLVNLTRDFTARTDEEKTSVCNLVLEKITDTTTPVDERKELLLGLCEIKHYFNADSQKRILGILGHHLSEIIDSKSTATPNQKESIKQAGSVPSDVISETLQAIKIAKDKTLQYAQYPVIKNRNDQVLVGLYRQMHASRVAFPTKVMAEDMQEYIEPKVVTVDAKTFASLKLADFAQWAIKLLYADEAEGQGSANQYPDVYSKGGRSWAAMNILRQNKEGVRSEAVTSNVNTVLNSLIFLGGRCGENGQSVFSLPRMLDKTLAEKMGLPDPAQFMLYKIANPVDHGFGYIEHTASESPIQLRQETYIKHDKKGLPVLDKAGQPVEATKAVMIEDTGEKAANMDPWVMFPGLGMIDNAYFHVLGSATDTKDKNAVEGKQRGFFANLNLFGVAAEIREQLKAQLNYPLQDGLLTGMFDQLHIKNDVIRDLMLHYKVDHPTKLPINNFTIEEKQKFDHAMKELEPEIDRKILKVLARNESFRRGLWHQPGSVINPQVIYKNEETGETLGSGIPTHYFKNEILNFQTLKVSNYPPDVDDKSKFKIKDVGKDSPTMRTLRISSWLPVDQTYLTLATQNGLPYLASSFAALEEEWVKEKGGIGGALDEKEKARLLELGLESEITNSLNDTIKKLDTLTATLENAFTQATNEIDVSPQEKQRRYEWVQLQQTMSNSQIYQNVNALRQAFGLETHNFASPPKIPDAVMQSIQDYDPHSAPTALADLSEYDSIAHDDSDYDKTAFRESVLKKLEGYFCPPGKGLSDDSGFDEYSQVIIELNSMTQNLKVSDPNFTRYTNILTAASSFIPAMKSFLDSAMNGTEETALIDYTDAECIALKKMADHIADYVTKLQIPV